MKKGFNTSIGCSRKKYKSSHRLAPLTSTPMIGTNARRIKEVANKGIINFFKTKLSNKTFGRPSYLDDKINNSVCLIKG